MTIDELKELLISKNIPQDAYCLSGGLPNECLCLNKITSAWEVYYSERGKKSDLRIFNDENEACNFIYLQLEKIFIHGHYSYYTKY